MQAIYSTEGLMKFLHLISIGKVREMYAINGDTEYGDKLLIVTTDRISTYDVIHPNGIPHKGIALNQLSRFWFEKLKSAQPHHFITSNVAEYPDYIWIYRESLEGRSMLVRRLKPLPIECVVRGYLYGSGWTEYQKTGQVCGIKLPEGLQEADKLPKPIFTPATKATSGHDINISAKEALAIVGEETLSRLEECSIAIYKEAANHARSRGIIISDTKFEFALDANGRIVLIDELLTPDSSRFWEADSYEPGRKQDSLDKQYVRDYVTGIGWDRNPPAPALPEEVVKETSRRYLDVLDRLT